MPDVRNRVAHPRQIESTVGRNNTEHLAAQAKVFRKLHVSLAICDEVITGREHFTNSRLVIRTASKEEDIAAPGGIDPRRHWTTVEQFATGESQVTATLHFETVNQIGLQFANHSGQARRLFEVIKTLKHGRGPASATRKRPTQTGLMHGCGDVYIWRLNEIVEGQIFEFGMDAIVCTVRKHMDVPPLPLHLPDPARRMNALAECDK